MSRKEETEKDIKKYSAIEAMSLTDGGKILRITLEKDVLSAVDTICTKYKTVSHTELIALCAGLAERLVVLRILNRAPKNKEAALKFLTEEGVEE